MRYVVMPGIGFSYALGSDAANFRFLAKKIPKGAVVYDIGANKGQLALFFSRCTGTSGHVYAFEPAPVERRWLKRNIELNHAGNVVTLPIAVADQNGSAVFTYHADRPTQGKLLHVEPTYLNREAREFLVQTQTLDSIISEGALRPDVLKIDVEGAAAVVLRGASRLLEESSPPVYVELHGPEEQEGIRDELIERGYVAETLDGDVIPDPTAGWHSPLWCYKAE